MTSISQIECLEQQEDDNVPFVNVSGVRLLLQVNKQVGHTEAYQSIHGTWVLRTMQTKSIVFPLILCQVSAHFFRNGP